jgi:outer membrane receptor protein involved in Fe transport
VQTLPIDEPSRQANLYSYGSIAWPSTFTWILGLSVNDYDSVTAGATKWNPKFGVIWTPTPSTALRAAAFRVSKRDLVSDQTIEPTQVAGFNQFFDDSASTQSTRYGIGIDQRFGTRVFGGLEATRRFLDVPFVNRQTGEQRELEAEETFNRAYLYWTPMRQLALRAEYQFDLRSSELADARVSTRRAPIGASWFLPNGLTLSATATWVNQDAKISDTQSTPPVELSGEADFWVADAQVSYRLPNRHGAISVGVRNLFGQEVRYFDLDPSNPWLYPERFVYVRLELQF